MKRFSLRLTNEPREGKFFRYVRFGIFFLIVLAELGILYNDFVAGRNFMNTRFAQWLFVLAAEVVFTVSVFLQTFVLERFSYKIACYVVDFLMQLFLTVMVGSLSLSVLYILFLSEFYMSTVKFRDNLVMGVACLVVYVVTTAIVSPLESVVAVIAACLTELLVITVHFLIVNFTLYTYDTKKELNASLKELDESNRKLQKAYDELATVTALQERQRIAKDIHDNAGHAVTTVIMQTEAAKLLIDKDPTEAKTRIVAANLQAKNALEELRRSVHLLAGEEEEISLKQQLLRVVHDSSDGTGVVVRANIEDVACSESKARFLVNTLKEGISNGLRHGHATAFFFELVEHDGQIDFLLSDNGVGAEISTVSPGFGIKGMRRRAESFGGKLYFTSAKDEGFEVRISLPADGADKEERNE